MFRSFLWVLLLVFVPIAGVRAQQPDASHNLASHELKRYVLLKNDHVLSGQVMTRGELITIRKDRDAELTLRSDQIVAVRDNLQSLFEARKAFKRRRTRMTLGEMLDDASWCVEQGMPDQATQLLMAVYRVIPNHPVATQLEGRLRRKMTKLSQHENTSPEQISRTSFTLENQPTLEHAASHDPGLSISADARYSALQLHAFTARVQPILVSRCGRCHDEASGRDWRLTLPQTGSRVSRNGTITNLESSLAFCQPGDPDASDLVRLAAINHDPQTLGRARPPIAEHELHLIRTLSQWIAYLPEDAVAANTGSGHGTNPASSAPASTASVFEASSLREASSLPEASDSTEVITASPDGSFPLADVADFRQKGDPLSTGKLIAVGPSEVQAALAPPPPMPAASALSPCGQPRRLPLVKDPNDAGQFNRQTKLRRHFGLH